MARNRKFVSSLAGSLVTPLASAITGLSGISAYAVNGLDPKFVSDFTADGDYFRVAGNDATFSDAYTSDSEAGGLVVQRDSSGNAVWGPHNQALRSEDFSVSPWTVNAGTVSRTPNAGTAPDGTNTATRIDATAGVWTVAQSITSDFNFNHTGVLWYKSNGNGKDTFRFLQGSVNLSADLTATSEWQSVSLEGNRAGSASTSFGITRDSSDNAADILVWGGHHYRSDLGGMAEVPSDERGLSTSTTYIPTTTAARYLLRRGHYDYDGSTYNRTCLHEPEGATNECAVSRDPTGTGWGEANTGTAAADAVGFDGEANTAYTITDSDASGFYQRFYDATCPDDSNPAAFSVFMKKEVSVTTYPGISAIFTGGTTIVRGDIAFDPTDGSSVIRSGFADVDDVYVEDWNENLWRVTVVATNNGTGNTTARIGLFPAVNTDGSATWTNSTTGSAVFDQVDVVLNASIPSSPIITAGAAVTRSADTMKGKAASLPFSSTAISMAVKGRYNTDGSGNEVVLGWYQDSNDRILIGDGGSGGSIRCFVSTGGDGSEVAIGGAFPDGLKSDIRAAARVVASGDVQIALNGTAGTAESSTTPAMPPLSDDDLQISSTAGAQDSTNGQIDTIRLWDADIETAGIEQSTS